MIAVTQDPISIDELISSVSHPGAGAIVIFLGVVRDNNEGRKVRYLEYESYEPAAKASMQKICGFAKDKWPGVRISAVHRVGKLNIGDISVAVVASAPHRQEAFAAARFVIDSIKEESPIWKKEIFEGGEVWIGDPSPS
ncbi:molybdopterin biosynthesis MoaE protein [Thermobaculum terrenum ATCC BAA-798]|uniref:Molybdopterin biosynthesis MoaE protein n=1 Tax=Thermobaculum terrenum (strain ATCC BAA-798 / CCMEE 7001 / YNP1) TaxID=525904 RepID=D1CDP7_THET1|nr:molybdenum cofactor biosynthesis protein MoaE [Thermobaculum terrenum]ACZ41053.1 molybdopterin biosynthesis MoaE protein [Thermobaculum terrenum ATCC BAA-798]